MLLKNLNAQILLWSRAHGIANQLLHLWWQCIDSGSLLPSLRSSIQENDIGITSVFGFLDILGAIKRGHSDDICIVTVEDEPTIITLEDGYNCLFPRDPLERYKKDVLITASSKKSRAPRHTDTDNRDETTPT